MPGTSPSCRSSRHALGPGRRMPQEDQGIERAVVSPSPDVPIPVPVRTCARVMTRVTRSGSRSAGRWSRPGTTMSSQPGIRPVTPWRGRDRPQVCARSRRSGIPARNIIAPWSAAAVEVAAAVVAVRPQSYPRMVPAGPRRGRRERGNLGRAGRRADEAAKKRCERRRPAFGGQLAAARHKALSRDRQPVGLHRSSQRLGAGEARAGQVLLDRGAAGDPRVERARLDNHPPAVSELGGNDLRQVPRTEQHARRTGTEITVAPVTKEGITKHGDQYPRWHPKRPSGLIVYRAHYGRSGETGNSKPLTPNARVDSAGSFAPSVFAGGQDAGRAGWLSMPEYLAAPAGRAGAGGRAAEPAGGGVRGDAGGLGPGRGYGARPGRIPGRRWRLFSRRVGQLLSESLLVR